MSTKVWQTEMGRDILWYLTLEMFSSFTEHNYTINYTHEFPFADLETIALRTKNWAEGYTAKDVCESKR